MADEHNAVERPRSAARIRHGLGWRMRKLKRRVREAAAWRARKAKRAYDARYRPPSTRRGMYVRLLKGECATGTKSSIVFVADNVGTDAHGVADVLGLALALAESGHGVRVNEVGKPIPDADVVVGATRLFDPSTSPGHSMGLKLTQRYARFRATPTPAALWKTGLTGITRELAKLPAAEQEKARPRKEAGQDCRQPAGNR